MKLLLIVAAALIGTADVATAANTQAQMAQAFRDWCMDGAPRFEAIDAKATAKKLVIVSDMNTPLENGNMIQSKTWAVDDGTGSYAVNVSRAIHDTKHVAGCSVYFPDISDDDVAIYLQKALQFGEPRKQALSDDGKHLTYWSTPQPNVTIMLTSGKIGRLQGAMLNILQTAESGH